MRTEETRALIERYYETLPRADAGALAELLAEDCEWLPPASAPIEPVRGREALATEFAGDLVKRTFDLSQPLELTVRRVIVDGPVAVVQQRLAATAKNGNRYENEYCWVYECENNQIARMEEYGDSLHAANVMGWISD